MPKSGGMRPAKRAQKIDAVVAIDGPADLVAANHGISTICGGSVLEQLLASVPDSEPERWPLASPGRDEH
jgi:hypothetical protein